MDVAFYIASFIAVATTAAVVTGRHPIHALLNFVISLLAVAVIFLIWGAPLAASLEVIVYAGAIIVLFVFIVMMLNTSPRSLLGKRRRLPPGAWAAPVLLTAVLGIEFVWVLAAAGSPLSAGMTLTAKQVGVSLFGPYLIGVEVVSMLLLAALVGAYRLASRLEGPGKQDRAEREER